MTDQQVQKEVIEFRKILNEYSHKVGDRDDRAEVERLRTEPSLKWGRIGANLGRIGFPSQLMQFGQTFPIMFIILREGILGPDYEAMRTVDQGLVQAIGVLQRRIEETPAPVSKLRVALFALTILALLVVVWSLGRFHEAIWSGLWRGLLWTWDQTIHGKLLWQSLATLALTIAGGVTANRMHEDGITGSIVRRPISTLTYLTATVAAIVGLFILA